jgi:hypothetical protein
MKRQEARIRSLTAAALAVVGPARATESRDEYAARVIAAMQKQAAQVSA